MGERRELAFERIEEVMPEVERLLLGHSTSKGWTLGQILHHLSSAVRLSFGSAGPVADPGPDPDLERKFEVRRRRFFRSGQFPSGIEVPLPHPALVPPEDADARAEASSLRDALRLIEEAEGPFPAHPWLGTLSRSEWRDFHRIHCAHHLGFAKVVPTEGAAR